MAHCANTLSGIRRTIGGEGGGNPNASDGGRLHVQSDSGDNAMRAPANAPVVHGDKEKPELTRQYNEGYKTDLLAGRVR